eukprot:485794-Prymnesium_polylepis.1
MQLGDAARSSALRCLRCISESIAELSSALPEWLSSRAMIIPRGFAAGLRCSSGPSTTLWHSSDSSVRTFLCSYNKFSAQNTQGGRQRAASWAVLAFVEANVHRYLSLKACFVLSSETARDETAVRGKTSNLPILRNQDKLNRRSRHH